MTAPLPQSPGLSRVIMAAHQRQADASKALSAAANPAASDYSSDKDQSDAEAVSSMLGFQRYWDATYADELINFREHGHAGEVWFGADVMETVAIWTKNLCLEISQRHFLTYSVNTNCMPAGQTEKDFSGWSVLDIGTDAKYYLTGTDYTEAAIALARSLADRDGFSSIKFLVDDILETKLDWKFQLVTDKGTLDAIGLHPDGPLKSLPSCDKCRIMCWDSVSELLAPVGILGYYFVQ
ncbi:hypothetical protein OROGR_007988 [Orobanche gracilis]